MFAACTLTLAALVLTLTRSAVEASDRAALQRLAHATTKGDCHDR